MSKENPIITAVFNQDTLRIKSVERKESLPDGEGVFSYSYFCWRLKDTLGKTLTIIDGAIPEGKQNKAVKDSIRNIYVELYGKLFTEAFGEIDEEQLEKDFEQAEKDGTVQEVTLEEIAGA